VANVTLNLGPHSKAVDQLSNMAGTNLSGRRGRAIFTATSGNVTVLGLRFKGLAFTSIPAL
jgi:hypothetical protein